MEKETKKNILILIVPIAVIAIAGFGLINAGIISTDAPDLNPNQINVTLILNYGEDNIDEYTVQTTESTVYSVLIKASEENNFYVVAEYYESFDSYLIESINNVKGEGDMFWQYYVNGEMGMVGANSQTVEDNDVIEWKYEKFEY